MSPIKKQLRARVGDHAIGTAIEAVLDAAERFAARKSAITLSPTLTELGKTQALKEAVPAFLKEFCVARRPIEKMAGELKARRAALVIKPLDRTDSVGAIERTETREWLRSLNLSDRRNIAMTTRDPQILEAMLAKPEMSGFTGNLAPMVDHARTRYLELTYGEEVRAIEATEAVLAEAAAAAQVAKDEIRRTSGENELTFNRLAEPIEKQFGAPWLLKNGDRVMVVEVGADGMANYRPAATDEIETGVFYKDAADFQAARAPA